MSVMFRISWEFPAVLKMLFGSISLSYSSAYTHTRHTKNWEMFIAIHIAVHYKYESGVLWALARFSQILKIQAWGPHMLQSLSPQQVT